MRPSAAIRRLASQGMKISPIPKTAPFAEEEIDILNRVVGPASTTQRAWLAGFLAGLDAAHAAPQPAAPPQAAEPLTILYATESGNAERLASDVAKSARKLGFKPMLVDMADLELVNLAKARRLVVIASTWGEGEPPARAVHAYAELMGEKAPRLDGVEFAVLALGDTAYAEFCAIGKAIDARLAALGGKRAVDRIDCDLDFAEPAAGWIDATLHALAPPPEARGTVIAVDFAARQPSAPDLGIVEAEIVALGQGDGPPRAGAARGLCLSARRFARCLSAKRSGLRRRAAASIWACRRRGAARKADRIARRHHALAQDAAELRRRHEPCGCESAARFRQCRFLDRGPTTHRSRRGISGGALGRGPREDHAPARPPRLFDRLLAARGLRRSPSPGRCRALRQSWPAAGRGGIEPHRRPVDQGRKIARKTAAEPAFRAAGAG